MIDVVYAETGKATLLAQLVSRMIDRIPCVDQLRRRARVLRGVVIGTSESTKVVWSRSQVIK